MRCSEFYTKCVFNNFKTISMGGIIEITRTPHTNIYWNAQQSASTNYKILMKEIQKNTNIFVPKKWKIKRMEEEIQKDQQKFLFNIIWHWRINWATALFGIFLITTSNVCNLYTVRVNVCNSLSQVKNDWFLPEKLMHIMVLDKIRLH